MTAGDWGGVAAAVVFVVVAVIYMAAGGWD
jgi:hypothetical protein